MVSNIEYIKLGITIITSIISILGFYHKFIMKKIDEKVDQKLYDKEVEYMKTQTKYNYTNLKEKIETVFEDIKDNKRVYFKIEEFVLFFFY
ncbi:MAG: hypothetical protein RR904_05005 [Bacilli bacterium]